MGNDVQFRRDLKKIFHDVSPPIDDERPIDTLICDIFDTLVDHAGTLNKRVHEFLIALKKHEYNIVLVSTQPDTGFKALKAAGCDDILLAEGVHNKTRVQQDLSKNDIPHVAIDDMTLIWLEAGFALQPNDDRIDTYIKRARGEAACHPYL